MCVAVCQLEVVPDVEANLATIARLAEEAAARGATLTVFPEASVYPIGATGEELEAIAQPLDGAVADGLRRLATRTETAVVVGVVERSEVPRKVFNTVLAFGPDGSDLGAYRKIHLYDAFGSRESDRYLPGPVEPLVFPLGGFTVGVMTCYDLRFPELARALVDAGADVLLVPAAWAQGALKEEHWSVLLRARAIENTCYVAAAGQCGPAHAGRSTVIDPLGVALCSLAEAEGVATAGLLRDRLDDVRRRLPVLANRRLPRLGLNVLSNAG